MEQKVLYPSRKRLLLVPASGLLGIVVSYALISETLHGVIHLDPSFQRGIGWFVLFCSALWIGGGILNFLPGACFLKLNDEGLTAACLFLSFHVRWENIRNFRVIQPEIKVNGTTRVSSQTYVGLDLFDTSRIKYNSRLCTGLIGLLQGPEAYAAYVLEKFGVDAVLATDYGLTTEELAHLLNEWRLRRQEAVTSPHG